MTPMQTLGRGQSLAAWQLSPVFSYPFPGVAAVAHDPQNYRYINGFVDVGDLPCRIATWSDVASRQVALKTDWAVESLYLPGANRRVEFTHFRHTPTRLERWCRTWLAPEVDRYVSYRLSTRGGVHIWVDGVLAGRFEPFTRNGTESTVVHLPLRAAGSEVVVLTEDMAERDTIWFFELNQIDDVPVTVSLPGATATTSSRILAAIAAEIRCAGEYVLDAPVTLVVDTAPIEPVSIIATFGSVSHDRSTTVERTVTLYAGATSVALCNSSELPEGYAQISLVFICGSARVQRTIGCSIVHRLAPTQLPGDLAARKAQVLRHLAEHGELRMGTALAMLAVGHQPDKTFRTIVEQTLDAIENRHDCSDFVIVPLLWTYQRYGSLIPSDLFERARAAILNYRYWVDEPGNDVMWFWSENHALCFHTAQLLAAALFPDSIFSASGRTGAAQQALAVERLGLWFDAVEEDGLAEWNSAAYYPVDLIGLLALVELAPKTIAARARVACDRIFTMVALHATGGVPAGSMGRAYDKELRAGPLTELAPFVALAWGRGWLNRGVASLPQFAAGHYTPPDGLDELAWPEAGSAVEAIYRQGFGNAAQLRLFKTDALQLSTNTGSRAGGYGHQQHVVDLLFASNPYARAWINHPGEDDPWGSQRPSYWAGNGVLPRANQDANISLLLYDLGDAPRLAFTHAYIAADVITVSATGRTLILRAGKGLAAILSTADLVPSTSGPTAGREWRANGTLTGWAIVACEHDDVQRFQAEVSAMSLSLDSRTLAFSGGERTMSLNWTTGAHGHADEHLSSIPKITRRSRS